MRQLRCLSTATCAETVVPLLGCAATTGDCFLLLESLGSCTYAHAISTANPEREREYTSGCLAETDEEFSAGFCQVLGGSAAADWVGSGFFGVPEAFEGS